MERKDFLKKLSFGLISGSLLSGPTKVEQNPIIEDCTTTPKDILGPYFVEGSPEIVNLNTQNLPGIVMMLAGTIYSGEGDANIIKNAKIEIWHADDKGVYHPAGNGDISNYKPSQVTLRGHTYSSESGQYGFQSIRPGLYGNRSRHIHFMITASGHKPLVTQSYFREDPRLRDDYFSKTAGDCRIVSFEKQDNGEIVGILNFNLEVA